MRHAPLAAPMGVTRGARLRAPEEPGGGTARCRLLLVQTIKNWCNERLARAIFPARPAIRVRHETCFRIDLTIRSSDGNHRG